MGMKQPRKAGAIFSHINRVMAWLAGFIIVGIALAVGANVILRYFLHQPIVGVTEISGLLLLYILFLGTAWVLEEEAHVKLDLLTNRLSSRNSAILGAITSIVGTILCLVLLWYGASTTLDLFQRMVPEVRLEALPRFVTMLVVPIGSFFLVIQFLRRSYGYLSAWREPRREKKEIPTDMF